MKKFFAMAAVVLTVAGLSACNTPGERAVGGALIGGGGGALVGAALGGPRGALIGAGIGAAGGAVVGAATTPQAQCPPRAPYLRYDAYGNPFCSPR